jgi:hypothetical protein
VGGLGAGWAGTFGNRLPRVFWLKTLLFEALSLSSIFNINASGENPFEMIFNITARAVRFVEIRCKWERGD